MTTIRKCPFPPPSSHKQVILSRRLMRLTWQCSPRGTNYSFSFLMGLCTSHMAGRACLTPQSCAPAHGLGSLQGRAPLYLGSSVCVWRTAGPEYHHRALGRGRRQALCFMHVNDLHPYSGAGHLFSVTVSLSACEGRPACREAGSLVN